MPDPNYRLRRIDRLNWTVERYKPGKVKPDGTESKAKWIPDGYYPTLDMAAQNLLTALLNEGASVPEVSELIEAVHVARGYVAKAVQEAAA